MDDKTLLEMAAKAAGPDVFGEPGCYFRRLENHCVTGWNPLADDGDALRLAVDLGLVVDCSRPSAALPFTRHAYEQADYTDQKAATRRAIVHAAAAIGSAHEAQVGQP